MAIYDPYMDHLWPCMAIYGHIWPYMSIYGPYMAIYDHLWSYMTILPIYIEIKSIGYPECHPDDRTKNEPKNNQRLNHKMGSMGPFETFGI